MKGDTHKSLISPYQLSIVHSGLQSLTIKDTEQHTSSMTLGHIGVTSLLAFFLVWQHIPTHCTNEPCLDLYKGLRRRSRHLPMACRFYRTLSAVH